MLQSPNPVDQAKIMPHLRLQLCSTFHCYIYSLKVDFFPRYIVHEKVTFTQIRVSHSTSWEPNQKQLGSERSQETCPPAKME